MSQQNKQQLKATNNANFPNNNSAFITPEKLRDFNTDIIDSVALDVDTELSGSITVDGDLTVTGAIVGDITASTDWNALDNKPSGLVSGSSQVTIGDTTGNLSGTRITGTVANATSASYAVTASHALNAGASDWNDIENKPSGLVSGSSQVSYPDLSNIPSGIVSSSAQITDGSGIVSSSDQVSDLTASLLDNATSDFSTITFTNGDGTTFEVDTTPRQVIETVINKNGNMVKGTPVYVSGSTGNSLHVYAASASRDDRMPATFVLNEDLNTDEEGTAILSGFINGVNTDSFQEGDSVYVGANGGYTNTRPTGSNINVQKLGNVIKKAVNGSGVITGAGRSNDVPNIAQGNIWIGDANGVAQSYSTSSINFALTDTNNSFTGNQTFNDITVNGTGSFAYISSVTGSAKIIGDAYIVLNNDTPTERYAGIKVYDSGSADTTASFEFDGSTNDWFYQYSDDGGVTTEHGVALFGPEYSSKGTPTYPTNNKIQKGNGGHHLLDSNITDNGSTITLGSNTDVQGNITVSGNVDGVDVSQLKSDFDTLEGKTLVSGSDQVTSSLDSRYASLASNNTFTANQTITGSVSILGNLNDKVSLGDNTQVDLFQLQDPAVTSGITYNVHQVGYQNYPGFGAAYQDVFAIEYADSTSFNHYSGLYMNGGNFTLNLSPSGSAVGKIKGSLRIRENFDGEGGATTELWGAILKLDAIGSGNIDIGTNTFTHDINIGTNNTSAGTPVNIEIAGTTNITGSTTLTGSFGVDLDDLANNSQTDLFKIANAESNGNSFTIITNGYQNYPGFGSQYEDTYAVEFADSSGYNYSNGLYLNGGNTTMNLTVSGSPSVSATMRMRDNGDGTANTTIFGSEVDISAVGGGALELGTNGNTSQINIGNGSSITVSGSVDMESTLTASLQEGYVWVGGAGNRSELLETSSLGGDSFPYTGDAQITGSLGVTKSIGGGLHTLSITSNTASIDLTDSNTYELTLVSSADTHLDVSTFGEDAQSINILVKQPTSGNTGSISFSSDFKFGQGYSYTPTPSNSSEDMLSFLRVGSYLYGTYINNFS